MRALDYLAERQFLELKVAGVRHRFKILRRPDDTAALSRSLYDRALQRERREIARLGQVAALVEHDGCQVAAWGPISAIRSTPCGHCSWCRRGGQPARLKPTVTRAADQSGRLAQNVGLAAAICRATGRRPVDGPILVRRFLAAVGPRQKLQSHVLFGTLGHVPFQPVLREANSNV